VGRRLSSLPIDPAIHPPQGGQLWHFRAMYGAVRVKKTRQDKKLEPRF
jgi:hypothetical protein